MTRRTAMAAALIAVVAFVALGLASKRGPEPTSRQEKIPPSAVKVTPSTDIYKPVLHAKGWCEPEPVKGAVNTAGAEDSAYVTPDGKTMYFFFTPDGNISVQQQLSDQVTGVWYSTLTSEGWGEAKRLDLLGDPSLDGAQVVQGDVIWFASARQGNYRDVDIWVARLVDSKVSDVRNAGERLNKEIRVGEIHVTRDGKRIYFHADLPGGKGGDDIWLTSMVEGRWSDPVNVPGVNSREDESRPFLNADETELWFTKTYMGTPAIYRSTKTTEGWSEPDLIISVFAAEPSLDDAGNIYFIHHFFKDGKMLEADVYVAKKLS